MAFTPGIITENFLTADQTVGASDVPVDVTGFTFNLGAAKKLWWEVGALFSTNVIGGFRFVAHSTVAPTTYNARFQVVRVTTPATFQDAQVAEAAFTNASAVASTYILEASGFILAAGTTMWSFQFAQDSNAHPPITIFAGARLRLTQV